MMTHEGSELQRRFESIKKHAHRTYIMMREGIHENQPAINEGKLGRGFITHGSIASYVRKASREATGHDCNQERVNSVRAYLRYTHNVCALNKVGDGFTYRIFIREEWNEWDAVLPLVFGLVKDEKASRNWYERKVTAEEAGETMAPSPVTTMYACDKCERRFESQNSLNSHKKVHKRRPTVVTDQTESRTIRSQGDAIVTYGQTAILRALSKHGEVTDSSGRATQALAYLAGIEPKTAASCSHTLEERGWISRTKNAKRTFSIKLTDEGSSKLNSLNDYRFARDVLAEYLAYRRVVVRTPATLNTSIAEELGVSRTRITRAARALVEEGLVEARGNPDQKRPHTYVWLGESDDETKEIEKNPEFHQTVLDRVGEPVTPDEQRVTAEEPSRAEKSHEDRGNIKTLFTDEELTAEIYERLVAYRKAANKPVDTSAQEKLDLIASILSDFESGKIGALKALGDVQEATRL